MAKSIDTLCVKDKLKDLPNPAHVLPIFATSAFSFDRIEDSISVFSGSDKGFVYSRYGNPTIEAVQDKIAALEGIDITDKPYCLMTSSGMSAIATIMNALLTHGDKVLTQGNLYGGTTEMFNTIAAKNGIGIVRTDLSDESRVHSILTSDPGIKVIYFETPANPTLSCIDLECIKTYSEHHDIITVIDNTFSTPYLQRPFNYGIDYIVHSTTKYLNGHGNSIAGAIVGRDKDTRSKIWDTMKLMGTNCNPWDAWLVNNGLKTLSLRMDRHSKNALELAVFLENHGKVRKVNYPGLPSHPSYAIASRQMYKYGGMLSFEIDGDYDSSLVFMNSTQICSITSTLGNVDTLLLHPASSSHLKVDPEMRKKHGITDTLVRVSVGIEDISDLKTDFDRALSFV